MEYKDYYKILGVEKTAGKDELKAQYRKLARQYHPDVNTKDKNAASRFSQISEAYEVLSDDDKRRRYDGIGPDWGQNQTAGQSGQSSNDQQDWGSIFADGADGADFFRSLFGQGFHGRAGAAFPRRGQDLHAELSITLEEAYSGGARVLNIGNQNIRLALKPGIRDRQTISIEGKGEPGSNGGENGDLYITFIHQPHPSYRLDGTNLYRDINVSIYAALLGTTQAVQTISGTYQIRIPPGTQNGTVFRLKGRGFPAYDKAGGQISHGDLFLKVALQLPEKLNSREAALFRELATIRNERVGERQK